MTKESKRNQELLHMEISNSVSLCWVTVGGTLRAPSVQGDFRIHPIKLH